MRIGHTAQTYSGYQKTTGKAAPSKSFGQVMAETNTQDRYSTVSRYEERQTLYLEQSADITKATKAKLKQLMEINSQTDFTGMSSEEIYADIWNRYDEAFDGNMVAIMSGILTGPREWADVHNQFYDEAYRYASATRKAAGEVQTPLGAEAGSSGTGNVSYDAFVKVLGYEGMSFEEREAAIKEKYAGKNTALDFLKMQGELNLSGVLAHKMGKKADTYCAMLGIEFERALNPNSIYNVGFEKSSDMTMDQWNHALAQPFDTAKFAAAMKENLSRISVINGYSADIEKMMSDCIDRFISGTVEGSIAHLLDKVRK